MTDRAIFADSLADQVFQFLLREIVEGRLKPGERILEKKLVKQLGISRTPIREALLKLEAEGIVVCNSRRSYNVRVLSVTDVKETFEILGIMESAVVRSVVSDITESDLELLREYNRQMAAVGLRGDFHAYGAWNEKFHDVFFSKYPNRAVRELSDTVRRLLYTFPVRGGPLPEWVQRSVNEHDEIIRLAAAKDGAALETYMRAVHWSPESHGRHIDEVFAGDGTASSRPQAVAEKSGAEVVSSPGTAVVALQGSHQ